MPSNIDSTKPTAGTATTASIRANMAAAKIEIEALQAIAILSEPPPHNIMCKSLCGGVSQMDAGALPFTSNHQMVLPTNFYAMRIGVRNAHPNIITGIKVQIAVSNTFGAAGLAASRTPTSAFINSTFGGATTGTLAAGTVDNDTITWFDWADIAAIARIAGGTLPVVHVRIESQTNGTNNRYTAFNIGDWTGFNLEANIAGGRAYVAVNQATDGITTPLNFTQNTSTTQPIAILIQYASFVKGKTILTTNDSLSMGGGSTYKCYSDSERAAFTRSTINSPIEVCNLSWGGQNSSQASARSVAILGALAELKVTHFMLAPFTPNDGSIITVASINAMKSRFAKVAIATKKHNVNMIIANALPSTPGGTNGIAFNATDALRTAFNAEMLNTGYLVYDRASVLSGVTDVNGQVNYAAGVSTDNLHPNETGWELLKNALITRLSL